MGIKSVDNIFKGIPLVGSAFQSLTGGGGDKSTPTAAATTNSATTDSAANQGKLNPLILTSASGATDPYSVGKKLLLGQ